MQIIVLGTHRSGTSVATRLINMMGAYIGSDDELLEANEENPKGFWERKDMLACNDAILAQHQAEWDCLADWDMENMPTLGTDMAQQMQSIIRRLDAHPVWMAKDPRFCLTLPCWQPYLSKPVAVIVHRDPLEVAHSLHKRNGLSLQTGLAVWEYSVVALLNATRHMPRVFLKHADILRNPVGATEQLYKNLEDTGVKGLHMPATEEITAFVEPKYYRSKGGEGAHVLSPHQQQLVQYCTGEKQISEEPLLVSHASVMAMQFHSFTRQRQQLEIRYDALRQHVQRLEKTNEELKRQLTELRESSTWRFITWPARIWRRVCGV